MLENRRRVRGDPEHKGRCQEAMNSHHCASRFGKSGGGFKKENAEKLALLIETGLTCKNGTPSGKLAKK